MTTVADIMNSKLLYIEEGERLTLARAQILRFGVTAIPVLDSAHRPVGVVTLRDLPMDGGEAAADATVRTIRSDASLAEGALAIADYGVHRLVVVDERGAAVGMVSALDFVRAMVGHSVQHPPAFARY